MRSGRGFTLMEMLIALLIGMVVVSQLYILTRAIGHDTTKQQMETEAMQRARVGIELLTADFERAGLNASPNPGRDPDSMVNPGSAAGASNQLAYQRPAIVHMNNGAGGPDSIIIVGSFVTSNTYRAYLDGGTGQATLTFETPFASATDCTDEFMPGYAFAHVIAPNGQSADASVSAVDCPGTTSCTCTVTLDQAELFVDGPSPLASGQLVSVAANQAALYGVESIGADADARSALVRRFVQFNTDTAAACDPAALAAAATDESYARAKVIVDYVTDFQVWFRNMASGAVGTVNTTDWFGPQYYDLTAAARLLPCDQAVLFDTAPNNNCNTTNTTHLSCDVVQAGSLGPEHVRSAVIRLSVRTEKTDQEVMKFVSWGADAGVDDDQGAQRLVRYNAAPPPSGDVGAYKVRTVVTEVMLPNMAARMASFTQSIPAL